MRLIYLVEIVLFSILTFSPVPVWGQARRGLTRQQMDSILHPKVLQNADQLIRFADKVVNLGTMTEDHEPMNAVFSFQNVGNETLEIRRIITDCGCTKASTDKKSYLPGEKGTLKVKYTPKNRVGTIDASTWIYSSVSASQPIARLILIGEVFPGKDEWKGYRYTMGSLRLKRKELHFNRSNGNVQTERILCANSGIRPLQLRAKNLPDFLSFRTEPAVIKPGEEADMVIKVDLSLIPKKSTIKITYVLEIEGLDHSLKGEEKTSGSLPIVIDLPACK